MEDNGLVISTDGVMARVEVQCFDGCKNCSARSLCGGQENSRGLLAVKNPLNAQPGDEVIVDVPETTYTKALILLFGSLLAAALAGMGVGYAVSTVLPLPSSLASFSGLLIGLLLAGILLARSFRKKSLYPVITDILKKGDSHG